MLPGFGGGSTDRGAQRILKAVKLLCVTFLWGDGPLHTGKNPHSSKGESQCKRWTQVPSGGGGGGGGCGGAQGDTETLCTFCSILLRT